MREGFEKRVLNRKGKGAELAGDGGFVNVVTDADPQTGEKRRISASGSSDRTAVFLSHLGGNRNQRGRSYGPGVFNPSFALSELDGNQTVISLEYEYGVGRGVFFDVGEDARHTIGGNDTVNHAQFEELAGELLGLFSDGGHAKRVR